MEVKVELIVRSCGGCTACCKTHGVELISKKPGHWCGFCEIGKGCKVYEGRPIDCKTFKCLWLDNTIKTDSKLEEWHRPDITKIVPTLNEMVGIGIVLWLWEVEEDSLATTFASGWTWRNLIRGRFVVHIPLVGNPKLLVPEGKDSTGLRFTFGNARKEFEIVQYRAGRFGPA